MPGMTDRPGAARAAPRLHPGRVDGQRSDRDGLLADRGQHHRGRCRHEGGGHRHEHRLAGHERLPALAQPGVRRRSGSGCGPSWPGRSSARSWAPSCWSSHRPGRSRWPLALFTVQFVFDRLRRERPTMAASRERAIGPFVGFVSGATNGALGASGPVIGSFLLAIGLRGRRSSSSRSPWCSSCRGSSAARSSRSTGSTRSRSSWPRWPSSCPALIGQQVGLRLRGRVDAKMFQRILLTVLLISSVNLLLRGLDGALDAARAAGLIG